MKFGKVEALAALFATSFLFCVFTAWAEDAPLNTPKKSLLAKPDSKKSKSNKDSEIAEEYFEAALRLSPEEREKKLASLKAWAAEGTAESPPSIAKLPLGTVPAGLVAPEPIEGNKGKFLCPFTSDGVMAKWTDKAVNAKLGETVGSVAGNQVGKEVGNRMKDIPMFGMFLGTIGEKVGKEVGRSAALAAAGGEKYMRDTSDLSFNNIDDLAVYIYVKHSSHPHYDEALKAAKVIYPELEQRYYAAISTASSSKH